VDCGIHKARIAILLRHRGSRVEGEGFWIPRYIACLGAAFVTIFEIRFVVEADMMPKLTEGLLQSRLNIASLSEPRH
jgi:hypothetical protein